MEWLVTIDGGKDLLWVKYHLTLGGRFARRSATVALGFFAVELEYGKRNAALAWLLSNAGWCHLRL